MNTTINTHVQSIVRRTETAQKVQRRQRDRIEAGLNGQQFQLITPARAAERDFEMIRAEEEDAAMRCGIDFDTWAGLTDEEREAAIDTAIEQLTDPVALDGGADDDWAWTLMEEV